MNVLSFFLSVLRSVSSPATVPKDPNPQWRRVAWSYDCTLLAYTDSTGTVRLFDLMGSELFVIPPVTVLLRKEKKKVNVSSCVCVSQSENQHLPVLSLIPLLAQDPSAQPCKYHSQSYSMIPISIVSSIFSDDCFGYSMLYLN